MILFIYGQDTYRAIAKLNLIKAKYLDTNLGDTNLNTIDFSHQDLDFNQISQQVLAMPFLAPKRLVIFKNLLRDGSKKLTEFSEKLLSKIPETTILLFFEDGLPDRRSSLFKKLNQPKQAEEFKLLEANQLRSWIKNKTTEYGASIESQAIEKLILYVGNNLWRLDNEIKKLATYNLQLTTNDIELLVKPSVKSNIFDLVDSLAQKNISQAHQELQKLLQAGENELYILTMIVNQFRNLLIVKDLSENSNFQIPASKFQVTRLSGLHPFVAEKSLRQCRNFTLQELKAIYQILLEYDIKIKSGQIEPKLALDLLIVDLIDNEAKKL